MRYSRNMRSTQSALFVLATFSVLTCACLFALSCKAAPNSSETSSSSTSSSNSDSTPAAGANAPAPQTKTTYLGFDRNTYPGDDALPILRKTFAFSGFWLGPPPGEKINTWQGKRQLMQSLGFGFAALYRARRPNEVKKDAQAREKGSLDARAAAAAAKSEGFAPHTIIFLDIEDGGRLAPSFHVYLRAWADELGRAGYRPGVYCSGVPDPEGPGVTVVTADDIRNHIGDRELVYWIFNDVCPPAPGCTPTKAAPPVSAGGVPYAAIWQFAQSPRVKDRTAKCTGTYAADGNCYAPGDTAHAWFLDLNSAGSADPSSPTN